MLSGVTLGVGALTRPSASEKADEKPNAGLCEGEVASESSLGPPAFAEHISLGPEGSWGLAALVVEHMVAGKDPIRPPKLKPLGFGTSGGNGHSLPVAVFGTPGSGLVAPRGLLSALTGTLLPWAPVRLVKRLRRRRKLPCWNMSWQSGSRVQ